MATSSTGSKIAAGAAVAVVGLAGVAYCATSYYAGSRFHDKYMSSVKDFAKKGNLKQTTDVSHGPFSSRYETHFTPKSGQGALKFTAVTEVSHAVSWDKALSSQTTVTVDKKRLAKLGFTVEGEPKLKVRMSARPTGAAHVDGQLMPFHVKSPTLQARLAKAVTFSSRQDGIGPVSGRFELPLLTVRGVAGLTLKGLKATFHRKGPENDISVAWKTTWDMLRVKPGRLRHQAGFKRPFALQKAHFSFAARNLNVAAARKQQAKASKKNEAQLPNGMNPSLLKTSPDAALTLDNHVRSSIGQFALKGRLEVGDPNKSLFKAVEGKLFGKIPYNKKATRLAGPAYGKMVRQLLAKKILVRKKHHAITRVALSGGQLTVNGKRMHPLQAMMMMMKLKGSQKGAAGRPRPSHHQVRGRSRQP